MTAARTRLEPSVRRELILDAAERVLADRMPSEVTFEEIADAVSFLLSEKAVYITGEVLNINGGMLMD